MPQLFNAPIEVAGPTGGRRADASDVDSGSGFVEAGKMLSERSDVLVAANARLIERDSTVSRVLAQNAAKKQFRDIAAGHVATSNMADPGTTKTYDTEIRDVSSRILSDYSGNPGNRALLTQFLDTAINEASRSFGGVYIDASKSLLDTQVTSGNSAAAAFAAKTGNLEEGLMQVRLLAEDLADARTSAETDADIRAGSAGVYQAIFNTLTKGKDWVGARELLDDPELTGFIDGPTMQKMRNTVLVGERELEKGKNEAIQDRAYVAELLNKRPVDVTTADLRLANKLRTPDLTAGEKLQATRDAFVLATGRAMNNEEIAKALGVFIDEEKVGAFDKAGSRRIAVDVATLIMEDTATDIDIRDFLAATTELTRERLYPDKDGIMQSLRGELSQPVREALERLGVDARGVPLSAGAVAVDKVGAPPSGLGDTSKVYEKTVWGLLRQGTGLVSTLRAGITHLPWLGEMFPSQAVVAARAELKRVSRELVDLYRLSNRGITEINELETTLNISPEALETVVGAQATLIGIDRNLDKRIRDANVVLDRGNISAKDDDALRRFVFKAGFFRKNLGLPPLFKKHSDAFSAYRKGELQPGTEYRGTDDVVYAVPSDDPVGSFAAGDRRDVDNTPRDALSKTP